MPDGVKVGDAFVEISPDIDTIMFAASGKSAAEIFDEEFNKEIDKRFRKTLRQNIKIHLDQDIDTDSDRMASEFARNLENAFTRSVMPILASFPGRVAEILATPLGPAILTVALPAIAAAGVTLGTVLGGAILAGLGTVAFGAALAVAINNPVVKGAFADLGKYAGDKLGEASIPFKKEMIGSIGLIKEAFDQIDLGRFFNQLSPLVSMFASTLREVAPGLNDILQKMAFMAKPFGEIFSDFIVKLVPAIERFIDRLASNLPALMSGFTLLGNVVISALDAIGAFIQKQAEIFEGFVVWGAKALDFIGDMLDAMGPLAQLAGVNGDKFHDMSDNMMRSLTVTGDLNNASQDLTINGLRPLGGELDKTTQQYDALTGAILRNKQEVVNSNEALENLSGATLRLRTEITNNGQTLSIYTTQGLANRDALEAQVEASNKMALQEIATGTSVQQATENHRIRTDTVINEMFHTEELRGTARGLRDDYTSIPNDVKTVLEMLGYDDIETRLTNLKVKQIALWKNISESEARSNLEKGMASGGYVTGPDTKTSDSIAARLSNGEYVMQAAAVDQYGVGFMHAINQQVLQPPGFVKGGPVGPEWPFAVDVSQTEIQDSWANVSRFGMSGGPTGDLSQISGSLGDWIREASKYVNIEWPAGLMTLIMRESGGNPFSINLWDINAQNGDPSGGLMQTIGATFRAYRDPRLPNNMFDPVANIVAGMNYIHSRYGSLFNVQQAHAEMSPMGYDSGGYLNSGATMVANSSGQPEPVFSAEQWGILKQNINGDHCVHEVNVLLDGAPVDAKIQKSQQNVAQGLLRGRGKTV